MINGQDAFIFALTNADYHLQSHANFLRMKNTISNIILVFLVKNESVSRIKSRKTGSIFVLSIGFHFCGMMQKLTISCIDLKTSIVDWLIQHKDIV